MKGLTWALLTSSVILFSFIFLISTLGTSFLSLFILEENPQHRSWWWPCGTAWQILKLTYWSRLQIVAHDHSKLAIHISPPSSFILPMFLHPLQQEAPTKADFFYMLLSECKGLSHPHCYLGSFAFTLLFTNFGLRGNRNSLNLTL